MKILISAFLLLTSISFVQASSAGTSLKTAVKAEGTKRGKKLGCWKKIKEACGKRKKLKGKDAKKAWKACRDKTIPTLSKECQEKIETKMAKRKGKIKEKMKMRLEKLESKLKNADGPMKERIQKRIKKVKMRMSEQ